MKKQILQNKSKPLTVAAALGLLNEEDRIEEVVESLVNQTYPLSQIVLTNDGSIDRTWEILKRLAKKYPQLKIFNQVNHGPAQARNRSWRAVNKEIDIIAFTDGNCVPERNWVEEVIKPFQDDTVGATGGAYKTLNPENILARFFGMEIAWKYSKISGDIDAHGTYNLAIRRKILEEVGGFDERYKKPSGEDWDLTYKISRKHRIVFVPSAVVGTHHPTSIRKYLKTQVRRGYDRMMLYNEHPERGTQDNYTGKLVKYQIWMSGMLIPCLVFLYPFFPGSYLIPLAVFLFMLAVALIPFPYYISRDFAVALFSIPIQLIRNYAWFWGMLKGMYRFGFINVVKGVLRSGL